ncbi:hypothetical protein SAMN02982989_1918 [Xaviernesmea oryzae]|uniref:DUF465 domain-containing protein n=1 Tax=Xaviernesmea oryzae TaxID=464029 RepID=A0A1X7EWK3_9HYPH|nr:hypothetical protein [Xaviernesmea oryzae]SMF41383.1 hypothetical protein SAMN02982989_1918 [Xaviernesmea oryzae]
MSIILKEHQERVSHAVSAYRSEIAEIEAHIRLRAMSADVSDAELALLRRLKDEKAEILYRYENLKEAFRAILP